MAGVVREEEKRVGEMKTRREGGRRRGAGAEEGVEDGRRPRLCWQVWEEASLIFFTP